MRSWIRHFLGMNTGTIEVWWEGNRLMVGFRCECGETHGIHESLTTRVKP